MDQRLVRERYIDQLSHEACALYLLLVTVADAHPAALSWLGAVRGRAQERRRLGRCPGSWPRRARRG